MKKSYFISALIVGVIVVGLSESEGVIISNKTDTSGSAVQDGRISQLKKSMENIKRTWENMKRKPDDKEQEVSFGERHEGAHRGMTNNMLQGSEWMSPHEQRNQTPPAPPESEYLKEIASVLSIPVSKEDTPGDIAFKIKQCIGNAERYRGEVLSDESFELAKSAIGIPTDAETFKAYHAFIKKVIGKRIVIVGDN